MQRNAKKYRELIMETGIWKLNIDNKWDCRWNRFVLLPVNFARSGMEDPNMTKWIRRNIFSAFPYQRMCHLLDIKRPRQQIYNSLVFWPAQRSSVITAKDKAFPMKQVSGNASYSQDPEDPAFPPEQLPPDSGDDVSGNAYTANYGKEDVEILELNDIVPVGDSLPLLKKEFDSGSGRPREDSTFSESLQSRPIASMP